MPNVVIAYDLFPNITFEQEILDTIGATAIHTHNLDTPEALEAVRHADALMVTIQRVTADIIDSMENCRIISRVGTGLDAIDLEAATQRGIWVTNVTDYAIDEVSTHAITLLLTQARRLVPMLTAVHDGRWADRNSIEPAFRLQGQTLGIIGFGRIGQQTAIKAKGLGLNVIAHDPYLNAAVFESTGAQSVALDTLFSNADYISLHAPLTDTTHEIIDAAALSQMKPTAYLINTARGQLINEGALLNAVKNGQIAGAALDVLTTEPPSPDHPFLADERILISPHGAWYSEEARRDVCRKGAEEVVRVLRGETPRSPANQPNIT